MEPTPSVATSVDAPTKIGVCARCGRPLLGRHLDTLCSACWDVLITQTGPTRWWPPHRRKDARKARQKLYLSARQRWSRQARFWLRQNRGRLALWLTLPLAIGLLYLEIAFLRSHTPPRPIVVVAPPVVATPQPTVPPSPTRGIVAWRFGPPCASGCCPPEHATPPGGFDRTTAVAAGWTVEPQYNYGNDPTFNATGQILICTPGPADARCRWAAWAGCTPTPESEGR